MAGRKLNLGCPEISEIIEQKHKRERDPWKKNRLLAVKLVSQGEHEAWEVAELCGISRGCLFRWLKLVRSEGLEALLTRNKGGRPEGWRKDPKATPEVMEELEKKLRDNDFSTLQDARRWLKSEHGIEARYKKVWYWAKKLGGVLRRPRPSHVKKNPEAQEKFKKELTEKLEGLNLNQRTKAKVWVMDEARFGLHTILRRVWSLRGVRPIIQHQQKYEWDYLHGSLEVVTGEAHFCHMPRVNLEADELYLEDLAKTDPEATHILIRDGAGFHLRDGDERLPNNIKIIDLPPYSPELNPCEQLWDLIKDRIANQVFKTVEELREALEPILKEWWNDSQRVLSLIGRPWLHLKANFSWRT